MEFWLSDSSTTIDLGDNVKTITLGESERAFEVSRFARSNGGFLKGIGNYSPKKFQFTRDDFIRSSTQLHAWNQERNTFMSWFTKPVYDDLYLNFFYSPDGSTNYNTLRTLVYSLKLPDDEFDETWNTNFSRTFELISPSGVFENAVATTGTTNISSTSEQTITITNNGVIEAAPVFYFTPDGTGAKFQVKIAEGFGFRLEGTFSSGVIISYNMKNGILKFDDSEIDFTNYLIGESSPFLFPSFKSTYVYVTASSGIFAWEFNERFI